MPLLATFRPRSATEILDATVQLYRQHAATLLAITTIVVLPPAVLVALAPSELGQLLDRASNLLLPISQGAIAVVIAGALHDETVRTGEAFERLRGRIGSLIGVQFAAGLLIGLGLLLLIVPGLIAAAWTAVAQPVVAIEQATGGEALGRSRALARGHFGHIIVTMVLAFVIVLIAYMSGALAIGILAELLGLGDRAGQFLAQLLFIPFYPVLAVATTLLYYDLRVRNEGADLEAMAAGLPPEGGQQRAAGGG